MEQHYEGTVLPTLISPYMLLDCETSIKGNLLEEERTAWDHYTLSKEYNDGKHAVKRAHNVGSLRS